MSCVACSSRFQSEESSFHWAGCAVSGGTKQSPMLQTVTAQSLNASFDGMNDGQRKQRTHNSGSWRRTVLPIEHWEDWDRRQLLISWVCSLLSCDVLRSCAVSPRFCKSVQRAEALKFTKKEKQHNIWIYRTNVWCMDILPYRAEPKPSDDASCCSKQVIWRAKDTCPKICPPNVKTC